VRISRQARNHAAALAQRRGGSALEYALEDTLDDDLLEDGLGDILGNIPIIGGLLGGGGGKGGDSGGKGGAAAAPAVDPATVAAMSAGKSAGGAGAERADVSHAAAIAKRPTASDVRNIVKDAIASHAAKTSAQELQAATHARLADEHAAKITSALSPKARQTQGSLTEQRLQTQATQEHRSIMRREQQQRESLERFSKIMARLEQLQGDLAIVRRQLGGGAEIVRGRAVDILGGRDALERRR
jgi:hypothetical protein